ncbi:uncharacterized protein [Drosophila tropicalis]|uniref:uncharacterized protein n=1 Tax=Drosophila tropicalis TaxID=46794 RepID=UPI0035AC0F92
MTVTAGGGVPSMSSKLSVCLLHFVLAVISGWALKQSNGRYALAAYGLFFGHAVLCILRHTHPNPGQVQRVVCDHSRRFAPVIFITLIIGELQEIIMRNGRHGSGDWPVAADWPYIVIGLYANLLIVMTLKCFFGNANQSSLVRLEAASLGLCVVWNIYGLWHLAISEENEYGHWSLGMAIQVLLNHFVLWRLALHFNITQLEVSTVGMCFSVIFALNACQELIDSPN